MSSAPTDTAAAAATDPAGAAIVPAWPAVPRPEFGPEIHADGVRFRVFSRHATEVTLVLHGGAGHIAGRFPMQRQGDVWTSFVPGCTHGQTYSFSANGPEGDGNRFDPDTALLDPCGLAIVGDEDGAPGRSPFRHARQRPRSAVVADLGEEAFATRPMIPMPDSVIYETHVRGFTADPSAHVPHPGTYAGFAERIGHLCRLGVTAVELLPIHAFDSFENDREDPRTGAKLVNYWGYSTVGFFAPHGRYAAARGPDAACRELQQMVVALHRAGLEVILDVVYNHTGEGNHQGPTLHFRGLDNAVYYHLAEDRRFYKDFSGCGNSVNCNHPVVRRMIVDSLRMWVTQYGIDGFRFDLASVLGRDRTGMLVAHAPLLEEIADDPFLADTKIIAEAWDAAGAYQVGSFPGGRWAEWNGKYRDDVRRYWRGDPGHTGKLATRFAGSSDLYQTSGRRPWHGVNFVTCHDGFTLRDLVSYGRKDNFANGEQNRDGDNNNHSDNHGHEGETDDPQVSAARARSMRNHLATLLLAQGVPMLLGGDEFARTQGGNNNAYCQDNPVSWFDWSLAETHRDLTRFVAELIRFRKRHPNLRRRTFFTGRRKGTRRMLDINWFRPDARQKDWGQDDGTLVALIDGTAEDGGPPGSDLLIAFNASGRTVPVRLPAAELPDRPWRLFLDTANAPPRDVHPGDTGPLALPGSSYPLMPRSMCCFHRPVG